MAYRRKEVEIRAGGLNILPPGDKIPDTSAQEIQNFRLDQAGLLISRRGVDPGNEAGAQTGGVGHTIHRHGDVNYSGVGPNLYRHWDISISSDFDGEKIGAVAYQDRSWFMNRGAQKKDDGTNFWNWTIEAPSDTPVATVSSQESKTIASFDSSESWTVTLADGTTVTSSSSSDAIDGQSLQFTTESTGSHTATLNLTATLDSGIAGSYREDDKFRIWIKADEPSKVTSVNVSIDVDTGDFTQNYYSADIDASLLSQLQGAWTPLEVRRGLSGSSILQSNPDLVKIQREAQSDAEITPDSRTRLSRGSHQQVLDDMRGNVLENTPLFEKIGIDDDKNWGNVQAIKVQVIASSGVTINLDKAEFIGGPNASLEGTFQYYTTYANIYGDESNPSPISDGIILDKENASVTLPISSDPQTSRRHLYRVGEELDQAYRVKTVNDNVTTSVLDDTSQEDAQNLNIPIEFDHDPAPEARGLQGPYFGKLLAWGSNDKRNRLWWTKTARPSFFPGSDDDFIGQWVEVGDDREWIYEVTTHDRTAYIYKERNIHRLDGDPDLSDPVLKVKGYGTVGPDAVANAGVIDYFVSHDGIYSFDGEQPRRISLAVDGIFRRDHVDIGPTTHQPINRDRIGESVLAFAEGYLFFSYWPEGSSTRKVLQFNPDTGQWGHVVYGVSEGEGFSQIDWLGKGSKTLIAVGEGPSTLYELEGNFSDSGNDITLIWHSANLDVGLPENDKVWEDVVVDIKTAKGDQIPATLTVQGYFDNSENAVTLGTVTSSERQQFTFPIGTNGAGRASKTLAVRIAGVTQSEVTIYRVMARYYVEARTARSFDTDETDLGTQKVKQVSEVEFDLTNTMPVGAALETSLPGNTMAERTTWTIPGNATRRPYRAVIEPYDEGREIRIRAHSLGTEDDKFKLHGLRTRVRTIGEYVESYESGQGFVWRSPPVDFGIERAKEARSLVFHVDTDSAMTARVLTDLPGNALAVRKTATLPDTSSGGERYFRIPLDDLQGRLWQVELLGNTGYRLYKATVESRIIGTYVEQYEAQAGAEWTSKEVDFGSHKVKQAFEIEIDVNAGGSLTCEVYSDLPSGTGMSLKHTFTIPSSTTRRKVTRSLDYIEGRLFEFIIRGENEFILYGARLRARTIGVYIDADQGASGARWDSTELDFEIPQVKELQELEFWIDTDGAMTLTADSDLPGNHRTTKLTKSINTGITTPNERKFRVPFSSEVLGRFFRFKISGTSPMRMYGARALLRPIGTFIEAYEGVDGKIWDSQELDFGTQQVKTFELLRLHCETEGDITATVYTDLPGEAMASRHTQVFDTGVTTTSDRIIEIELPFRTEGRLIRVTLSGSREIRLFSAQVGFKVIPKYLSGSSDQPGNEGQNYWSTDFDFGDERVKLLKEVEVVCDTDSQATIRTYTDRPDLGMELRHEETFNSEDTTTGRRTFKINLPGNVNGRLFRFNVQAGTSACRILSLRARIRVVGEEASWTWVDVPITQGTFTRQFADLPVIPTQPQAQWVDLPIERTPHIFEWANLPVVPTEPDWRTMEFPVEPSGNFEWIDIPVDVVE